jgi:hypothetical protein
MAWKIAIVSAKIVLVLGYEHPIRRDGLRGYHLVARAGAQDIADDLHVVAGF